MRFLAFLLALLLFGTTAQAFDPNDGQLKRIYGYCLTEEAAQALAKSIKEGDIRVGLADPNIDCWHVKMHEMEPVAAILKEKAFSVEGPKGGVWDFWRAEDHTGNSAWTWRKSKDLAP